MIWFWRFMIYSFLGFLLEIAFARITYSVKQDRKCLLVLPLCPVYGLGAQLILWFSEFLAPGPIGVMVIGFCASTAVEYFMSLFYEYALGVQFWDYSDLPLNLDGRVCLLFSAIWTVLALGLVYWVAPWVDWFIFHIPAAFGVPVMILFLSDLLVSSVALRRTGTTDVLRWYQF